MCAPWSIQAAGYDVVTIDTQTARKATRDALARAAREAGRESAVVQGNFDPRLLADGSPGSTSKVSFGGFLSFPMLFCLDGLNNAKHVVCSMADGIPMRGYTGLEVVWFQTFLPGFRGVLTERNEAWLSDTTHVTPR